MPFLVEVVVSALIIAAVSELGKPWNARFRGIARGRNVLPVNRHSGFGRLAFASCEPRVRRVFSIAAPGHHVMSHHP